MIRRKLSLMISEQQGASSDLLHRVQKAIAEIVPNGPSSGGAFGT